MSDDAIERVGEQVVEAIQYARRVLERRGCQVEVREVCVGGVALYTLLIDFASEEIGAVTGRWSVDGLRTLGMTGLAERVEQLVARRAS